MEKYLISLDLDGTILSGLYNLTDYTKEVFKKLNTLGHKIIITTGRPFRSSYFVYYKMGLDTPMICYNGQYILNPCDKNYKTFSEPMNKDVILDVYNNLKDDYYLFFSEAYDNIYSNIDDKEVRVLMHHNSLSSLYIGDLNKILNEDVHGTLILAKEGHSKNIVDYVLKHHKNIGARIWEWGRFKEIVELFSLKSNKGTALKKVMNDLGFIDENTIVCGDSKNDIDSFDVAGLKITLMNAEKALKDKADIVLDGDVTNDVIADYFNERFNLGIKKE